MRVYLLVTTCVHIGGEWLPHNFQGHRKMAKKAYIDRLQAVLRRVIFSVLMHFRERDGDMRIWNRRFPMRITFAVELYLEISMLWHGGVYVPRTNIAVVLRRNLVLGRWWKIHIQRACVCIKKSWLMTGQKSWISIWHISFCVRGSRMFSFPRALCKGHNWILSHKLVIKLCHRCCTEYRRDRADLLKVIVYFTLFMSEDRQSYFIEGTLEDISIKT